MKTLFTTALVVAIVLANASTSHAQTKVKVAREAAEMLFERFGVKVGRNVPELATRIESMVARYGDDALIAMKNGGPTAFNLVEAAGIDGAKAVRVLALHGEQGATRVLARPTAMNQFLRHGDEAAGVLVRHPGVAEPLVERGGLQAVKALGAVDPRNGRRLAMLMDGELANAGRHAEVLEVVAKHGDGAVDFLWQHKKVIAGGTALAAFLANPEPFLNGTRDIAAVAGESVLKPAIGGVFKLLSIAVGVLGVLLLALIALACRHGLPKQETLKMVAKMLIALFKK